MKSMIIAGAFALAAVACTHAPEHNPAVAQVEGAEHVVVRAEAGRIWWSHRAWTEPHELWALPGEGTVGGFVVIASVMVVILVGMLALFRWRRFL